MDAEAHANSADAHLYDRKLIETKTARDAKAAELEETQRNLAELEETQKSPEVDTEESGNYNEDIYSLPDTQIFRSVGAKAANHDVLDPETGEIFRFVEGTRITNQSVFAGFKGKTALADEVAEGLAEQLGGQAEKWQHVKGIGVLDYFGEEVKAEVHWFQEETVGAVKFKVKAWLE